MISLVLHIGSLRTNWSLKMSLNFDLLWKRLTHWRLLRCFWAVWQLQCLTSCESYIKTDSLQAPLITRVTADSQLGFWRNFLCCAKLRLEHGHMCFPADGKLHSWHLQEVGQLLPLLASELPVPRRLVLVGVLSVVSYCTFPICIVSPYLNLTIWIFAPGRSRAWLYHALLLMMYSCAADICFHCTEGELFQHQTAGGAVTLVHRLRCIVGMKDVGLLPF